MENTNLNMQQPLLLREAALQIAISQLGVQEIPKGSNRGPQIEQYLASVGLGGGYSWCQAFVHWCYEQAALKMSVANPVTKTGGVLACWNGTAVNFKMAKQDCIAHPGEILPGFQFILNYGHGEGHTGIIESVQGNTLHTIEGNSNTDGSREGYEVVRHIRAIDSPLLWGVIKY